LRVMDYIEFKFWKLGALILAAFVWGIFCGVTGRPLTGRRRGQEPGQSED